MKPIIFRRFPCYMKPRIFSKTTGFQQDLNYEENVKNTCGKVRLEIQYR